jgi:hypothetical protein
LRLFVETEASRLARDLVDGYNNPSLMAQLQGQLNTSEVFITDPFSVIAGDLPE